MLHNCLTQVKKGFIQLPLPEKAYRPYEGDRIIASWSLEKSPLESPEKRIDSYLIKKYHCCGFYPLCGYLKTINFNRERRP